MFLHRSGCLITPIIFCTRFNYNTIHIRTALLESCYHTQGPPTFKPASNIKKMLTVTQIKPLVRLQQQLDFARSQMVKTGAELRKGVLIQP